jgi:hypothetical protein
MNKEGELIAVLKDARALLAKPDNDYSWSSWESAKDALEEIDGLIADLRNGPIPDFDDVRVLFLPTGPIQEVSLSSGWGDEFLKLAERADAAIKR